MPAVSNHGLNADGDREHREVADRKRGKADFARVAPRREENKERSAGGNKQTTTHTHTHTQVQVEKTTFIQV